MKIRIKTKDETLEKELPNKMHLDAQIRYPSFKQKPKKGKGSFTRKTKHKKQNENDD